MKDFGLIEIIFLITFAIALILIIASYWYLKNYQRKNKYFKRKPEDPNMGIKN